LLLIQNVLISAAIIKNSIPDLAVRRAFSEGTVIRSSSTAVELSTTLGRKKFDRYFRNEYERDLFIHLFIKESKLINVTHQVSISRDIKDNQFLELALSGKANYIITNDADLLVLDPFEGIRIIKPREFVELG
jgi:uncharacterized protein